MQQLLILSIYGFATLKPDGVVTADDRNAPAKQTLRDIPSHHQKMLYCTSL